MKHIKLFEDFVNEVKYDQNDIDRIKTIAQKMADAKNKYNGGKSYTVDLKSLTDSRFDLLDKGQNNMGQWYYSVNIIGDVYLSNGINDQLWFNERDTVAKIWTKVKKKLDISSKEIRTNSEEENENLDQCTII